MTSAISATTLPRSTSRLLRCSGVGAGRRHRRALVKKTLFCRRLAYPPVIETVWHASFSRACRPWAAHQAQVSASDFFGRERSLKSDSDAGRPLLDSDLQLMGYISFSRISSRSSFSCLLWICGAARLFILAIQLFVTLIEFKLTTLAGFVLIPFGLF